MSGRLWLSFLISLKTFYLLIGFNRWIRELRIGLFRREPDYPNVRVAGLNLYPRHLFCFSWHICDFLRDRIINFRHDHTVELRPLAGSVSAIHPARISLHAIRPDNRIGYLSRFQVVGFWRFFCRRSIVSKIAFLRARA